MLVLAPAACIMSGIALSEAFEVFTRSIKFQLSGTSAKNSEVDVSTCTLCSYINLFNLIAHLLQV